MSEHKRNAYNARMRRYRRKKASNNFIAIDGEAFVDGKYVLLASSTGEYVFNENGLSTVDCFSYLMSLAEKNPKYKFVGFGFNYDVNMILCDFLASEMQRLWKYGAINVILEDMNPYRITWLPTKSFKIKRLTDGLSIEIQDTFGFFQTSFIKALESWDIPDPEGVIERGKESRAVFSIEDKDDVIKYCLLECNLLVELMKRLEESLSSVDLRPYKWNGAGAVAAALLRRESVQKHRVTDTDFPEEVQDAIFRAYFGGRFEVFQQGIFPTCFNYDINSAYPYEASLLPSLIGKWEKATSFSPTNSLWLVRWNVPPEKLIMPFPFRKSKSISYPSEGLGWYHGKEVEVAISFYPQYIELLEGWQFIPANDYRPFHFIPELYKAREKYKREGNAAEKALKLGLNSLYGKCAQSLGWKGKPPPFQSFFWAGRITAGTRAYLLSLMAANPKFVVSAATDGVTFANYDPGFTSLVGKGLGQLDREEFTDFFIAQPGVYRAINGDKEVTKSRGFFAREIDYEGLMEGWKTEGQYYFQQSISRRFVGIGYALQTKRFEDWRTWKDIPKKLSLHSSRKFYAHDNLASSIRLYPPANPDSIMSEKYTPKIAHIDPTPEAVSFIAGSEQPSPFHG